MVLSTSLNIRANMLALLAFSLIPLATALQYDLSIPASSPLISWYPSNGSAYADQYDAWQVTYPSYPGNNPGNYSLSRTITSTQIGQGDPIYWTNASYATVSFDFWGVDFILFGQTYGSGTVSMVVDGRSIWTPPAGSTNETTDDTDGRGMMNVLGQAQGLSMGNHTVSVTWTAAWRGRNITVGDGGIEVRGVRVVQDLGNDSAHTVNWTIPALENFGGSGQSLSSKWNWDGSWEPRSIANTNSARAFVRSAPPGMTTRATLVVPSNTTSVLVYGALEPFISWYYVTFHSDAPESGQEEIIGLYDSYSTYNTWIEQETLLFAAPWTTGYAGNITIWVNAVVMGNFGLDRVVFVAKSNSTTIEDGSHSGLGTGRLVGVIVGSLIGALLAIAAAVVWTCYKRRKRNVAPGTSNDKTRVTIDTENSKDFLPLTTQDQDSGSDRNGSPHTPISPYPLHSASTAGGSTLNPNQDGKRADTSSRPDRPLLRGLSSRDTKSPFADPSPTDLSPSTSSAVDRYGSIPLSRREAGSGVGTSPSSSAPMPTDHASSSRTRLILGPSTSQLASPVEEDAPGLREGEGEGDESEAFRRKWEVLQSLDSRGQTAPVAEAEYQDQSRERRGTRRADDAEVIPDRRSRDVWRDDGPWVETDAGRIDALPPNYNPAWRREDI